MVYISFLNTISAPCSIVLLIASAFLLSVECRLIEISSFLLSFLFFAAVVGLDLLGVLSLGSFEVSASSTNRGVSMAVPVVLSVEISMASRTGG